jgi:hypothetical protein
MIHQDTNNLDWWCDICGARFSRLENAIVHDYNEHKKKEKEGSP